jgi:hypothetical protein
MKGASRHVENGWPPDIVGGAGIATLQTQRDTELPAGHTSHTRTMLHCVVQRHVLLLATSQFIPRAARIQRIAAADSSAQQRTAAHSSAQQHHEPPATGHWPWHIVV